MSFLDKLRGWMPQGERTDRDDLDRPDLRRQVVSGILQLKQRGRHGVDALPDAVTVTVTVAGSISVVRGFVDDPAFDQEIEAELLNRLVGAQARALPIRAYVIQAGERSAVSVSEAVTGAGGYLLVLDGDAAGQSFSLPVERTAHRLGRSPWHGDGGVPNDIVVSQSARFVSRRAAVIERAGSGLAIRSLDQKDCLFVVRKSGQRIRPTHTRAQRVRLEPGDQIELTDGAGQCITLRFALHPPEEE